MAAPIGHADWSSNLWHNTVSHTRGHVHNITAFITSKMFGGACQISWLRHQIETFSALLALCAGNSPGTQRPVTRDFDVYFDRRPNKRLSKQSLGWWFETLSSPLWCHRNLVEHLSRIGKKSGARYRAIPGIYLSWRRIFICDISFHESVV